MAIKRMISKTVLYSDEFRSLNNDAKLLYYELMLSADDEGIINSAGFVCSALGLSASLVGELTKAGLLLKLDKSLYVIRHWRTHNYANYTKKKPNTCYMKYFELLKLEDGVYDFLSEEEKNKNFSDDSQQKKNLPLEEKRGEEKRKDKKSSEESKDVPSLPKKEIKKIPKGYGDYKNVLLSDEELKRLKDEFPNWKTRVDRLSEYMKISGKSYNSHYAVIKSWAKKDSHAPPAMPGNFENHSFDLSEIEGTDIFTKRDRSI